MAFRSFRKTATVLSLLVFLLGLLTACSLPTTKTEAEEKERLLEDGYYAVSDEDENLVVYWHVNDSELTYIDVDGKEGETYRLRYDEESEKYSVKDADLSFTLKKDKDRLRMKTGDGETYYLESIRKKDIPDPAAASSASVNETTQAPAPTATQPPETATTQVPVPIATQAPETRPVATLPPETTAEIPPQPTAAPETLPPETLPPETTPPETLPPAPAEEPLADPDHEIWAAHGQYLLADGTQNGWGGKSSEVYEASALTAIALSDVRAIDMDLFIALSRKDVKYLYTIDLILGTNDAGWETNAMINGKLYRMNGSYAVKVAQCAYDMDGDTKIYYEEQWIPDPQLANAETLTPDTLFMPAWQEAKDENGFNWTFNPVAIGGPGVYTLVIAQYQNTSAPETPGFGMGLVKKAARSGFVYEEVNIYFPAQHSYGIIGSFEGSNWGNEGPDVFMQALGDNTWQGIVSLKAGDEFKVRTDSDWTYNWGSNGFDGENFVCEADGVYVVTIRFNDENGTIITLEQLK